MEKLSSCPGCGQLSFTYRQLACWLFLLIISSCAVQVPPTGGAKDTTAPEVEKMSPPDKTKRFDRKEISIRFNEFVQVNNPNDQVVISPPTEEKPEYVVSGKTLHIYLRGALRRNTTYTINFGNAVTDNHEGNIISNLRYVFTTGDQLDSNMIRGNVLNSFTNKPEKDISVGLYAVDDFTDSTIYKAKPVYFSKTRDDGSFSLENIPDQPFYLVAFNDENKNLKYDKTEAAAFAGKALNGADTTLKNKTIWIFNPDVYKTNRIIDTFSRESGKYCFLVYRPRQFEARPVKNVPYFSWWIKGQKDIDSLFIFSAQLVNDSMTDFNVQRPDSAFKLTIKSRKKSRIPVFSMQIDAQVELNDSMHIWTSTPLSEIDTSRIIFKEDTIRLKPTIITYKQADHFSIAQLWKEKTRYSLELRDSALQDIYGQYSKKQKSDASTRTLKDYSSLKLNFILHASDTTYIVQLTNDAESVIYKEFSLTTGEERLFEYLLPGNYKIKVIQDLNKNGQWDNGALLKQQPEKVYYYPESINLKAYWDLEQTINLDKFISY